MSRDYGIFVGNMAYETEERTLSKLFGRYGKVVDVEVSIINNIT